VAFGGVLKTESTFQRGYESLKDVMIDLQTYIEVSCIRQRNLKQLGFLAPAAYEHEYYQLRAVA
jgi:hypothetical protein